MEQFVTRVTNFHKKFSHPIAQKPIMILKDRFELRFDMLREENEEYIDASEENDLIEVADAIGDMLYILSGTMIEHGLIKEIKPIEILDNGDKIRSITLAESVDFFEIIRKANEEYIKSCERNDLIGVKNSIELLIKYLTHLISEHNLSSKIELVFDEIHKSNMSKLGEDGKPIYREDGKILKGPNYFKPNIKDILNL